MSNIFQIIKIDPQSQKSFFQTKVRSISEVAEWLRNLGDTSVIYEVQKNGKVNSVWIFKEKTNRWGRTSTPSKNKLPI